MNGLQGNKQFESDGEGMNVPHSLDVPRLFFICIHISK